EAAAALQQAGVLRQQVARDVPGQGVPLGPDDAQVGLQGALLLGRGRLLRLPLPLLALEAALGVDDPAGHALLRLHEAEDLLLDAALVDLEALDLGEDGRVLLVGLDLVELGVALGLLAGVLLQVLLAAAEVLAYPGQLAPLGLHRRPGLLAGVADG